MDETAVGRQTLQLWTMMPGMRRTRIRSRRRGKWEDAVEVQHSRGLQREREHLRAVEQGVEHLSQGEDDLAIERFTEAIRLNPESAKAYRLRGEVYSKVGNWARAERDIAKAKHAEGKQSRTVDP